MQVNKIQNNQPNLNNKKNFALNFKGLYFSTPQVKEVVTRMPQFVEFLKRSDVRTLAQQFNIVITDYVSEDVVEYVEVLKKTTETKWVPVVKSLKTKILEGLGLKEKTPQYKEENIERTYSELIRKVVDRKPLDDFYFIPCTSIDSVNDEILASGLYTPPEKASILGSWERRNLNCDLSLLEKNEQFEKLIFSNQEEKEKFLNTSWVNEFLSNDQIKKLLADDKKIIITDGKSCSFYVANDIKEENGVIFPKGFRTKKYNSIGEFDKRFIQDYFKTEKFFNKIFFPNDEIKEKFLDSVYSYGLLSFPEIEKATDKFNLFVTDSDGLSYSYCLSTDLAVDADTVIPAGIVTPTYDVVCSGMRLDDLVKHLEFVTLVNGLDME